MADMIASWRLKLSRIPAVIKILLASFVVILGLSGYLVFRGGSSYIYRNGNFAGDESPLRDGRNFSVEPANREFGLLIPKLGVNAPVRGNVDGSQEWAIAPQILKGIGHYRRGPLGPVTVDGAVPGQKGNIFLFGHSQILGRSKEDYAGVFNDLEELKEGDLIEVYYQEDKYQYRVTTGQVVDKTDLKWVEHTDQETLTLAGCWPLGLDWKRYVVQAERI